VSGERAARMALIALCALAPLIYLPRVLLGRGDPLPHAERPAWTHLVVLTVGDWPAGAGGPELARFEARASRVQSIVAPAPSRAAAAASLWTGLYPRAHGVLREDQALDHGTWTLARAARSAGTRTAAFLSEPFASATRIGGFDEVHEEPGATGRTLGEQAAQFLERTRGERVLVWVHGRTAADAEDLLASVERALVETDRMPESLVILAALSGDPTARATGDPQGLAAPLTAALPGALQVGSRSGGELSLVDVAGFELSMLGLAPPAPLDARGELLWIALRGGKVTPGVLVQDVPGGGDLWLRGAERVFLDAAGAARAEGRRGERWEPLAAAEAAAPLAAARQATAGFSSARPSASAAEVPPGDWPAGW
jgi:hypothetical protein